jgi:hypothetical protein
MTELHNNTPFEDKNFVPKEGQLGLLCSNKKSSSCPSFGINNPNLVHEDVALNYFAGILVEAFLNRNKNERNKFKETSCCLL